MGENSIKHYVNLKSLAEMKFQIEMQFWAKLKGEKSTSLWFWSLPGVGKSSAIQEMGEELTEKLRKEGDNRRVVTRVIQANHLGEGELGGMAAKAKSEKGEDVIKKLMVQGLLPEKTDEEYNLPGIIFFDELGDAKPEVRPELLSFCDGVERKDGYTMPPLWVVVAAGNTEEAGGLTFGEYSINVRARFANFFLLPNVKEWLQWASTVENKLTGAKGLDPIVLSFIRENGVSVLFDDETKLMSNMERYDTAVSPRKWQEVSGQLKIYRDRGYFDEYDKEKLRAEGMERMQLNNFIIANLGPEIGEQKFINFINNVDKMIPSNDLITKNTRKKENAELKEKIEKANRSIKFLSFDTAIRKFINEFGENAKK